MTPRQAFLSGTLAAALAAAWATLRGSGGASDWLVLTASAALLLGPLAAGLVRAHPLPLAARALLLSAALGVLPLALFGSLLVANTHHRPLGAVTYAVVAGLCLLGLFVVTWRLLDAHAREPRPFTRWCWRGALMLAGVGVLVTTGRLASVATSRVLLLDVSLALGVTAILLLVHWPERWQRGAEQAGPWVWGAVVAAGLGVWLSVGSQMPGQLSPALLAPFSLVR